jgi:hypothetical protein
MAAVEYFAWCILQEHRSGFEQYCGSDTGLLGLYRSRLQQYTSLHIALAWGGARPWTMTGCVRRSFVEQGCATPGETEATT